VNKGTTIISKRLILIKLENNDFYCFANCPIIHWLFFVIVTSKLTSVYSWLAAQSAVVTLNMQAPPSTLSCAALALRLFRSLPPMPITSQSSRRERAQLSQLSGGGGGIFQQRTPNAEYRGEP